jgi:hypothetical protein
MPLEWLADEPIVDLQKIAIMPFSNFLDELDKKWSHKN